VNDFKGKFCMRMSLGNRAFPDSSFGPEQEGALWQVRSCSLLKEGWGKTQLGRNCAEQFPRRLLVPPLNMGNHRLIDPNRIRKRALRESPRFSALAHAFPIDRIVSWLK
jgi:hypothetical protein